MVYLPGDAPEKSVTEYSGAGYADTPMSFQINGERHRVIEILESGLEETDGLEGIPRKFWKVLDSNRLKYVLTYHAASDSWDIEPL